ncbi:MAG: methylmalonyl Co-A mutase-associated GTPase MeaB [Chloroflexi bacterium]|nr:methylmalonyl Co-A mutase-associated GTPase MeaB [Chloroflexota bacterium]
MELVSRMLSGDRNALARLISLAEEERPEVPDILESLKDHLGRGYLIGITGVPGGGKSTLVDRLTRIMRGKGHSVGIIAVDPSSPFSGGALLGDRLRMQQHCMDSEVFIRSMATRGAHGGLPGTVRSVAKLMDASGKDYIIIETAGVGQTELDIMKIADTILVVLTPEGGDSIQSLKAGLLEIADIFVVNKADRPGSEQMVQNLLSLVHSPTRYPWWQTPVLPVQAANDVGVEELWCQIEKHRAAKEEMGFLVSSRTDHRVQEFRERVQDELFSRICRHLDRSGRFAKYLKKVQAHETGPSKAAADLLNDNAFWDEWYREEREGRGG